MKVNYKKKCKTCPNVKLEDMTCIATGLKCSKCFMNCPDHRVACTLCGNYDEKESCCKVTGQFKDGGTFRICRDYV